MEKPVVTVAMLIKVPTGLIKSSNDLGDALGLTLGATKSFSKATILPVATSRITPPNRLNFPVTNPSMMKGASLKATVNGIIDYSPGRDTRSRTESPPLFSPTYI